MGKNPNGRWSVVIIAVLFLCCGVSAAVRFRHFAHLALRCLAMDRLRSGYSGDRWAGSTSKASMISQREDGRLAGTMPAARGTPYGKTV